MRIGIVGQQCAGKTTLADMIGYPIIKFAAPLYEINTVLRVGKSRDFMQKMSDLVKECFGVDKFLDLFVKTADNLYPHHDNLLCDDIRFLLEAEYLLKNNWKLIYIDAPEDLRRQRAEAQGLEFLPLHNSEKALCEILKPLCPTVIVNDDSLAHLARLARYVLSDCTK